MPKQWGTEHPTVGSLPEAKFFSQGYLCSEEHGIDIEIFLCMGHFVIRTNKKRSGIYNPLCDAQLRSSQDFPGFSLLLNKLPEFVATA